MLPRPLGCRVLLAVITTSGPFIVPDLPKVSELCLQRQRFDHDDDRDHAFAESFELPLAHDRPRTCGTEDSIGGVDSASFDGIRTDNRTR